MSHDNNRMTPVQRALWFVERHFATELTLDKIAVAAGASPFYLTRAFAAVSGLPLMRYVRSRRLTEAARALANGAPDILTVAQDWGYGSHEAFTRAFTEQFGVTPESVRARGTDSHLHLVEAHRMNQTLLESLAPPRFVAGKPLYLVGLSERYTCDTSAGIPAQWQKFIPYLGHVPGQIGNVAYGVVYNGDDEGNSDYMTGVEVPDFSRTPTDLARLRIPEQRYAVFQHAGHVSAVRQVWATIWSSWLPSSGHEPADGPSFERYDEHFNSSTGQGGFEIWIPLQA